MIPPEHCPWSDWAPGTVAFCEARLCEVVREPANAWSSLAYLLFAGFITKLVCDPSWHWFNGHAAWHWLNAVSIVFLSRFYREAPRG